MTTNDFLAKVLVSQTLADDSVELSTLQTRRAEVEKVLREQFDDCSPTIRYGGSKAKGTMIKESYDLDLVCYFAHDDSGAGETLEDLYNSTRKALEATYVVEPKASAFGSRTGRRAPAPRTSTSTSFRGDSPTTRRAMPSSAGRAARRSASRRISTRTSSTSRTAASRRRFASSCGKCATP